MYKIDIINKNNFKCTWHTLYVGRKLNLISTSQVTKFAVNYLDTNPECNNKFILDLAWQDSAEKVDELINDILNGESDKNMDVEYQKWIYSVLKEETIGFTDDALFKKIEDVFYTFNSPQNMHNFFRKVSDAFYYPSESKDTIEGLVEEFFKYEKLLIGSSK